MSVGPLATPTPRKNGNWRTFDVWSISLSAFFADLGYQAILAVFPLFLVLHLGAPLWLFGLSQALAYGPGALFAYAGGLLGERHGPWVVAVLGNAFIPLMALSGLARTPALAVALLVVGWWARNLRSPPRRTLLVASVAPSHRTEAFGFLHALDVGGGMLAALYAFLLVSRDVALGTVLLATLIPLAVSTVMLLLVRTRGEVRGGPAPIPAVTQSSDPEGPRRAVYRGILGATILYGFASFSLGFPVLTTALSTGVVADGLLVFLVSLGVSSAVGLGVGRLRRGRVRALAIGGYLPAAVGSAVLALAVALHGGLALLLLGSGILGAGLGSVETFEPALISLVSPFRQTSRRLGALSSSRSLGLFAANLILGLLFLVNGWYPYLYAGLAALAACGVLLVAARYSGSEGDEP